MAQAQRKRPPSRPHMPRKVQVRFAYDLAQHVYFQGLPHVIARRRYEEGADDKVNTYVLYAEAAPDTPVEAGEAELSRTPPVPIEPPPPPVSAAAL